MPCESSSSKHGSRDRRHWVFVDAESRHLPQVVGKGAAALGISNETLCPRNSAHGETCRFSSAKDPGFPQICESIRNASSWLPIVDSSL